LSNPIIALESFDGEGLDSLQEITEIITTLEIQYGVNKNEFNGINEKNVMEDNIIVEKNKLFQISEEKNEKKQEKKNEENENIIVDSNDDNQNSDEKIKVEGGRRICSF
jgi:hypothetical protein